MERIKIYFRKITFAIGLFVIGTVVGSIIESNKIENKNGSLYNTTKIAIVNLDEGVNYKEENRNFGREILQNRDENYVITGVQDAKSGILDGRYSAYIILPADFSANIVSVNAEPKKSLLKYEVSGNLSQEASDKAWINIMKLKEEINDDIGYVYISSILSEFHKGQDNALMVLDNDRKDKEVLMAISNLDLVATMDLREVERLENNIKELNITPDVEKNKMIIEAIDERYKYYLSETSDQLDNLKVRTTELNGDIVNIENGVNSIESVYKNDGGQNYSLDKTQSIINDFNNIVKYDLKAIGIDLNKIDNSLLMNNSNNNNLKEKVLELSSILNDKSEEVKYTAQNLFDETFCYEEEAFIVDSEKYPQIYNFLNIYSDKILEYKEQHMRENNAEHYITKVLISGFARYDYTQENITFENILESIKINVENEEDLDKALKEFAISRGMSLEEIEDFSLDDFIVYHTIEPLKSPAKYIDFDKVLFNEEFETALKKDMLNKREDFIGRVEESLVNDLRDNLEGVINEINKIILNNKEIATNDLHDLLANLEENSNLDISNISKSVYDDLGDLNYKIMSQRSEAMNIVKNHNILSNEILENLKKYNPLDYIKEDEINGKVEEFKKNNEEMKRKITDNNSEYVKFALDSYQNADKHIQIMREDIQKYQKESDEKIIKGLESAKKVKEETSGDNFELMKSYISKLPYTRNGTIINTNVYDLLVEPNELEGSKAINSIDINNRETIKTLIVLFLITLIMCSILHLIVKNKNEDKDIIEKHIS
ncbi:MAG: hypothetical protein ACLR60_03105 [Clostridium paraputrificum]